MLNLFSASPNNQGIAGQARNDERMIIGIFRSPRMFVTVGYTIVSPTVMHLPSLWDFNQIWRRKIAFREAEILPKSFQK